MSGRKPPQQGQEGQPRHGRGGQGGAGLFPLPTGGRDDRDADTRKQRHDEPGRTQMGSRGIIY